MFKQVIIATDLSKESTAFINCLGGLKAYGTKKCLLLQIRLPGEALGIANPYKATVFVEYEKILQNQKKMLEKFGYDVETRILTGFLVNEVNRIAVEEDYSAVVVGAQKHSLTGDVFFSALAGDLIYTAQKPVMLMRVREYKLEEKEPIVKTACNDISDHVLFPTDFSENADVAFSYIEEMAAGKVKKITLMHVQDRDRLSPYLENRIEEFNEVDNTRLQNLKKILLAKGNIEVDTVIKYGSPAVEILNEVGKSDVDLVVMGSQGRGYVKEFFLGSVSHNIARNSPSSVLLIPAKR